MTIDVATTFRFSKTVSLYFLCILPIQLTVSHISHGPWRLEAQWLRAPCSWAMAKLDGTKQPTGAAAANASPPPCTWNQKELVPGSWAPFTLSMGIQHTFPERKVLVVHGLERIRKRGICCPLSDITTCKVGPLFTAHTTRWDFGRSCKYEVETYQTQLILMQPLIFPH